MSIYTMKAKSSDSQHKSIDVLNRCKALVQSVLSYGSLDWVGSYEELISLKISWHREDDKSWRVLVEATINDLVKLINVVQPSLNTTPDQYRYAFNRLIKLWKIASDDRISTQGSSSWKFSLFVPFKEYALNKEWLDKKVSQLLDEKTVQKQRSEAYSDWQQTCQSIIARDRSRRLLQQVTEQGLAHEIKFYIEPRLRQLDQASDSNVPHEVFLNLYITDQSYTYNDFLQHEIKNGDRNLLILGGAGVGKTSLIEQLASSISLDQSKLAICLSISNINDQPIKDQLLNACLEKISSYTQLKQRQATEKLQGEMLQQLTKYQFYLFLDVEQSLFDIPIGVLRKLQNELPSWLTQVRLIVTYPTNLWFADATVLTDFSLYELLPFDENQRDKFITEWFNQSASPERNNLLNHSIEVTPDLASLASLPLNCAILCSIGSRLEVGRSQKILLTQAVVYKQFSQYYYDRSKKSAKITPLEKHQLDSALQALALRIYEQGEIQESSLSKVFNDRLFNLSQRLNYLSPIRRSSDTGELIYGFSSPAWLNYYAAAEIKESQFFFEHKIDNPTQGIYRFLEPKYKKLILLWFGHPDIPVQPKEELLEQLINFDDRCKNLYRFRAYLIAAEAVAGLRVHANLTWKAIQFSDSLISQVTYWSVGIFDSNDSPPKLESFRLAARETLKLIDHSQVLKVLRSIFTITGNSRVNQQIVANLELLTSVPDKVIELLVEIIGESSGFNFKYKQQAIKLLAKLDPQNSIILDSSLDSSDAEHGLFDSLSAALDDRILDLLSNNVAIPDASASIFEELESSSPDTSQQLPLPDTSPTVVNSALADFILLYNSGQPVENLHAYQNLQEFQQQMMMRYLDRLDSWLRECTSDNESCTISPTLHDYYVRGFITEVPFLITACLFQNPQALQLAVLVKAAKQWFSLFERYCCNNQSQLRAPNFEFFYFLIEITPYPSFVRDANLNEVSSAKQTRNEYSAISRMSVNQILGNSA